MKKVLVLLVALTISAVAFASEKKPVEAVFQRYWSAFTNKNFQAASAEILPSDLEATKAALLPVMLAAQSNTDKHVQELVRAFFGSAVGSARETLSPQESFMGVQRMMAARNPNLFVVLKEAKADVVFVRMMSDENAQVHYQVSVGAAGEMEFETLRKHAGRWWVRIKQDPNDIAAGLKAMFGQGS